MPFLSICMPTYNFGRFIGKTIDSILPQMNAETELIILDGGSTDNTPEIVGPYLKKHPGIHYHCREQKGGIDRDIALTISLAKGQYVWLFSSDDIMQPNALKKIEQELTSSLDVYLCGFTVCGLDIRKVYWDHPIFQCKSATNFDFQDPLQRRSFFQKAITTTAFFSFMGSLIIDKKRWDETPLEEEFYSSCYAHAARIFSMAKKSLTVRYLPESFLFKRGFNDSFLDRGIVHRLAISIEGYHRMAERFCTEEEAFHMRRTVCYELPLKAILISAKSQLQSKEEEQKLDRLVQKLYRDPSLANVVRKWIYFNTPSSLIKFLSFIYTHRRFFKYLRFERLKHLWRGIRK